MKHYSHTSITIKLFLGLVFSVLLAWIFYSSETKSISTEFSHDVDAQIFSIEREITLNLEALYALKGLYDSSEHVTAKEFNHFTSETLSRHPNIQALEWIPKVTNNERFDIELEYQKQYPQFEISERNSQNKMVRSKERTEYFPVCYVEPLNGNEAAIGFDLASNPERLAALTLSRDSGMLVITQSLSLAQGNPDQKAFLAFLPVYHGNPTTTEQRHTQLSGFVLGVFIIDSLINSSILQAEKQGIKLSLLDETEFREEILHTPHVSTAKETYTGIHYKKYFNTIGTRQWSMSATPNKSYLDERRSSTPFIVLLLSFVIIGYSVVHSLFILRRSITIEQAVATRTLELNEAKKELERISMQDGLTGLANRRHFDSYLKQEWAQAIREKQPISLIMIDIDFFKQFNDHYGHLAGDNCLKDVATELTETVRRTTDLVARYGGEEFAIIMPNTSNGYVLAEFCRENIEKLLIPHDYSSIANHITLSIGFSTLKPEPHATCEELITLADAALYKAKESGRNKVCTLRSLKETQIKS